MRHRPVSVVALFILVPAAVIFGQGGKVSIRLLPKPNRTAHFEMTQEMYMDVIYEGTADASEQQSPNLVKMTGKSTFAFTQKNGAMNKQGKMEAQVTYNKLSMKRSMNGEAMPLEDAGDKLIGKTITLIFDKEGNVVDVKVPREVEIPADMFKQIMTSMYNNLPKDPLAIGETTTMPFSMTLPIPEVGPDPLNMEGQTRYKLVAIAKDGGDRMARFEQTVEATLAKTIEVDTLNGKGKVKIEFKLTGGGGLELNLGKGILKTGDMLTTIDGKMEMAPDLPNAKLQKIMLHGTTKMVSSGHN